MVFEEPIAQDGANAQEYAPATMQQPQPSQAQGVPAVTTDTQPSYAIESYELLEDGVEYVVIMNSGGVKSRGPSFVFGENVSENIIKVFFANPYYEIVRSDQVSAAMSSA